VRRRLGNGPIAVAARAGAGPTIPHAESTIGDRSREQYEFAGVGAHAAGGLEIELLGGLLATAEYKLTFARPEISIAGGTGRTDSRSHHVAFGLAFAWPR
jgi:hypothetical protein